MHMRVPRDCDAHPLRTANFLPIAIASFALACLKKTMAAEGRVLVCCGSEAMAPAPTNFLHFCLSGFSHPFVEIKSKLTE
jgi:hypothetical protein